jgi:hypothetical protein
MNNNKSNYELETIDETKLKDKLKKFFENEGFRHIEIDFTYQSAAGDQAGTRSETISMTILAKKISNDELK